MIRGPSVRVPGPSQVIARRFAVSTWPLVVTRVPLAVANVPLAVTRVPLAVTRVPLAVTRVPLRGARFHHRGPLGHLSWAGAREAVMRRHPKGPPYHRVWSRRHPVRRRFRFWWPRSHSRWHTPVDGSGLPRRGGPSILSGVRHRRDHDLATRDFAQPMPHRVAETGIGCIELGDIAQRDQVHELGL